MVGVLKSYVRMLIIGGNCRNAKKQALMGLLRKILRVSAILLVGVLWSVDSQAYRLDTFRFLSRSGEDAARTFGPLERDVQDILADDISEKRIAFSNKPPHLFGGNRKEFNDSRELGGIKNDGQGVGNPHTKELLEDVVKEVVAKGFECGAEHWHNGNQFNKGFAINAIQECADKEVWSKPDPRIKGYLDKLIEDYKPVFPSSPSFTSRRNIAISDAPIWYREPYNPDSRWAKIHIQPLPIATSRGLLAPVPALINRREDLGFEALASKNCGFRTPVGIHREPGRLRYLDIVYSKVANLGFWQEAIEQSRKLSACLDLWKIKGRLVGDTRVLG